MTKLKIDDDDDGDDGDDDDDDEKNKRRDGRMDALDKGEAWNLTTRYHTMASSHLTYISQSQQLK